MPDPDVEDDARAGSCCTGDLPSPANPPAGCRFHTRCPWQQAARCDTERPGAARAAGGGRTGHKVACHYAEDILAGKITPHEVKPEDVDLVPAGETPGGPPGAH